jgi:uncharacterized membrane protein YdjX (TVP38/TMEM64 family)
MICATAQTVVPNFKTISIGNHKSMKSIPSEFMRLRRYWAVVFSLAVIFLLLFGVAEALAMPLLTDPSAWLASGGPLPALLSIALLVLDIWLPVPASIIMTANGVLFGVLPGALLSLTGSVSAALLGFGIGRFGSSMLKRLVTETEYEAARALLERWGIVLILVTRPVPILAETFAIMAGASSFSWGRFALACVAGIAPAAFLYALAGATATDMQTGTLAFFIVLLLTGMFWWFGRRLSRES